MARAAQWLASSLTVKLTVLLGIFIALPLLVHSKFDQAERRMRALVSGGVEHQSRTIAEALKPKLERTDQFPSGLDAVLGNFTADNTVLRLLLRPEWAAGGKRFYYIASAPTIPADRLSADIDTLSRTGVVHELEPSCTWQMAAQVRNKPPDQGDELLTTVVPINNRWGCWVLLVTHSASELQHTSIGVPFWQQRGTRLALIVYLAMAAIAAFTTWSVWRNLHRFQGVATSLRNSRAQSAAFSAQNNIPELAPVAAAFDQLVADLRHVAGDIRRAAEDNAHSFKTPLATIEAALGPLRRSPLAEDEHLARTFKLIDSSLARLHALVVAAQRLDNLSADLIEAPRVPVDLAGFVVDALVPYRETMAARRLAFVTRLARHAPILASREAMQVIVENIVDNAISFSPPGGVIEVSVTRIGGTVEFRVADQGRGIEPDKLNRIFERYFSLRPRRADGDDSHSGLGLWIVRRHVEAIGGTVAAANRESGGASIVIRLPACGKLSGNGPVPPPPPAH